MTKAKKCALQLEWKMEMFLIPVFNWTVRVVA